MTEQPKSAADIAEAAKEDFAERVDYASRLLKFLTASTQAHGCKVPDQIISDIEAARQQILGGDLPSALVSVLSLQEPLSLAARSLYRCAS